VVLVGLAAGDAVTVIIVVDAIAWQAKARKNANMLIGKLGGCIVKIKEKYR
jgi:hypothetical protein